MASSRPLGNVMTLDRERIRALCFDVDGTLADTDDHLVVRLAALLDAIPLVSGRRAERLARQAVMAAETPVQAAYAKLDELGLDAPIFALRERLAAIRRRSAARPRNPQAIDEVPHEMVAGVKDMIVALAPHFPMCTISTGSVARVERFLEHYGLREHFVEVIGAQTTARMKPSPEPLRFAATAMGVPTSACLMVGDTTIDIRTGLAAGSQTVGVLCGFGTEAELRATGADVILRTTSDLLGLLLPADDPLQTTAAPDAGHDDDGPLVGSKTLP